jgi:peptidoglycan/xylan/chitin deacetylase (PgdA/CDA1 family)
LRTSNEASRVGWLSPMMSRRVLKRTAVRIGRLRHDRGRRVVLGYHSIYPGRRAFATTPELFRDHLAWLKSSCTVVSLRELVFGTARPSSEKPLVAITLDDGYEDNHSYALPLLDQHAVPATFFLTIGLIDKSKAVSERFGRMLGCDPEEVRPLSWGQIEELSAASMEIGSHSLTHRNLMLLSYGDLRVEIGDSKEVLSERIGRAVDLFAYPFGRPKIHFDNDVELVLRQQGYTMGLASTYRGVRLAESRYGIPRFFVDGDNLGKLKDKVLGAYDMIGWWQEHTPAWVMKALAPEVARSFDG